MSPYGISIVICCHNGASRLGETIRHIALQAVPNYILWEFVIIDNNSTDGTNEFAQQEWAKYNVSAELRVVQESRLGLSFARARGFEEAQYEYVLLCDDDNWLASDYVTTAFKIMSTHPKIAALGGCGKLVFEIETPEWLPLSKIFAAGAQAETSGKVSDNKVYGAGCVIRKSAYEKLVGLGFKSLLSDRKGNQLTSGGDYELCYALSILGYDIWYDHRLQFLHYITKERLNFNYFVRYAKESSKSANILFAYKFIACDYVAHKIPALVVARNIFYFGRRLLDINLQRMMKRSLSPEGRLLLFRHLSTHTILQGFVFDFWRMVRVHQDLLMFREICMQSRMAELANQPEPFVPTLSNTTLLKSVKR